MFLLCQGRYLWMMPENSQRATITVAANSVAQSIGWTASLLGCHNYSDYPDYSGASSVAKSTYNLNPSFIIAVPAGANMVVDTKAGDPTTVEPWTFTVRKDHINLCGFLDTSVCSTEYTEFYDINTSITCTKDGCS